MLGIVLFLGVNAFGSDLHVIKCKQFRGGLLISRCTTGFLLQAFMVKLCGSCAEHIFRGSGQMKNRITWASLVWGLMFLAMKMLMFKWMGSAQLIGKNCSEAMTELDFSWCRGVSENAMGCMTDSLSQLQKLTLFGCSQVCLFSLFAFEVHVHDDRMKNITKLTTPEYSVDVLFPVCIAIVEMYTCRLRHLA